MILNNLTLKKLFKKLEENLYNRHYYKMKREEVKIENYWSGYHLKIKNKEYFQIECIENGEFLKIEFNDFAEKDATKLLNEIISFLKNEKIDCLLYIDSDLEEIKEMLPNSKIPYIPTGVNSLKTYELLEIFKEIVNIEPGEFEVKFEYFPELYLKPRTRHKSRIDVYLDEENLIEVLTSKNEVENFIDKYEFETKKMKNILKEMIIIAKKYDPTCYYLEDEEKIYLFNEEYDFRIEQIFEDDVLVYNIDFFDDYVENEDLEKLIEEFKKQLESFMKRTRMQAAIEGKAFDLIPRMWNETYGIDGNLIDFNNQVISNLTKKELNEYLKQNINKSTKRPMDKEALDKCHKYMKKKYKITKGFIFGELYIFSSPRKYFVIKEKSLA